MIAPLKTVTEFNKSATESRSTPVIVSLLCGLLLGGLFSAIWHDLSGTAQIALWFFGVAFAFVTHSLIIYRRHNSTRWDLLFIGQITAVLGAILFFIASL